MDECDPTEIFGTVLVDPLGVHVVRILSVIGTGSFAHVYLAETVADEPEKRAVKRLFKAGLDERQLMLQRQEAEVMKAMDPHENIIQLLATVEDANCLYLIMEYCELDLYEAITQQGGFPEDVVKEVFGQVADSVLHCHNSGFYHRDLKPENCLISTANYKVKLADFGLATADEWSTELGCGSVRYMAPECFELTHNTPEGVTPGQPVPPSARSLPVPPGVLSGGYSPAANDVWALGVILLNLLFGKNPWFEAHMTDAIFSAFAITNPNILRQQFNLTLQFDAILRRAFELDPRRRCSVNDLKLLVESITHFVETEPISPPSTSPSTAPSKRRGNSSSILSGPGWIVKDGETLPAILTFPNTEQPQKQLRGKETLANLKSAAAVAAVSKSGDDALAGSPSHPASHAILPVKSVSTHVPAGPSEAPAVEPSVSEGPAMYVHTSQRRSMSSSSTVHADDAAGEFLVVNATLPEQEVEGFSEPIDEASTGFAVTDVKPVAEDTLIAVVVSGSVHDEAVSTDVALKRNESTNDLVDAEVIRQSMDNDHSDKRMSYDVDSVTDSMVVRIGEVSIKPSAATPSSLNRESSVVESKIASNDLILAAEEKDDLTINDASSELDPSFIPVDSPTNTEPNSSESPHDPIAETEAPTSVVAIAAEPPAMIRHESNPYLPRPGAATETLVSVTSSQPNKRAPSPLKWFGPLMSRESARVDQQQNTNGKVGLFRLVRKKSSFLRKPVVEDTQSQDDAQSGISATLSSPFSLRKKRSVLQNKHVSTATTMVNGNGSIHNTEEGTSSLSGLEIEGRTGASLNGGKGLKKRSSASLKEFSSGLMGTFRMRQKRPDLATSTEEEVL
ncbi:kinase-like domain-containing protein [Chytriomyces sp. MP71]|nr:kinase-like domain-containing protein [Chytriomyces sp. MP71]